jgi:hypothetical protein
MDDDARNRGAHRNRANELRDISWTARMFEERKPTKRAIRTFERQPGFASMQLWLRDRMSENQPAAPAENTPWGTMVRAELALRWFNLRAEGYARLIGTVETVHAFIAMLFEMERAAWRDFLGAFPESVQPMATPASLWLIDQIRVARESWIRKAYEQVASRERSQKRVDLGGLKPEAWASLEIRFLSDERVQLKVGLEVATCNYAELGFEDRRSGKPNLAWAVLRAVAQLDGQMQRSPAGASAWSEVERRIQEIRKRLRHYFKLTDDPIPFVREHGYCARVKITCADSYQT